MKKIDETKLKKFIEALVKSEPKLEFSLLPPLCAGRQCNSSAWAVELKLNES